MRLDDNYKNSAAAYLLAWKSNRFKIDLPVSHPSIEEHFDVAKTILLFAKPYVVRQRQEVAVLRHR